MNRTILPYRSVSTPLSQSPATLSWLSIALSISAVAIVAANGNGLIAGGLLLGSLSLACADAEVFGGEALAGWTAIWMSAGAWWIFLCASRQPLP
jgi:hypothetical protein